MKVSRMIEELKKCNPNAEVKLHFINGNNALFVTVFAKSDSVVVIEDKTNNDLGEELECRFKNASENSMDELDFFLDLLETGFTLEDLKENLSCERYYYCKTFMEEHGLI